MPTTERKLCPSCRRERSTSTFGRNICNPDGLATYCRDCSAQKQRQWKANNPQKVKKWREDYIKRIKAANKKRYREENAEKSLQAA